MKSRLYPVDLAPMQDALKAYRSSIGKTTEPRHYINEVRLINHAVTGSCSLCARSHADSRRQVNLIKKVIRLNIRLIRAGTLYFDRKKACRDLYVLAITKTSPQQ